MSAFKGHAATGFAAAVFLAGLTMCAPANATTTAFSFSFTYGGGSNQTYTPSGPGTLLSSATTVTEGTNQFILSVNDVFGPPAGAVDDFIVYSATPLAVPSGLTGAMVDLLTVGWDTYTFTSLSGTYTRDVADNDLNFRWFGTVTDSSGILSTQPAQFSQTWSQSTSGNQPSTGGTFSSMPSVPEPATWTMMLLGFAGIGFAARRTRTTKTMATA